MGTCQQKEVNAHHFDHASRVAEKPRAFYSQLLLNQEIENNRRQASPAIKVSHLGFHYPRWFHRKKKDFALQDLSFCLEEGRCLGILGANGSGKSTLLSCLGGSLIPTGGEIQWFGQQHLSVEIQRKIGFLPDAELPFPALPAGIFLEMTARAIGIPKKEVKQHCEDLLTEFGLMSAQKRPHGKFSKGMKRRLGLSVALLLNPTLLLLDEPLSGMDPIGVETIRRRLVRHKERGGTALVSTHQLEEIEDLLDRIMILDQGRIVGYGTVHEVLGKEGTWNIEIADIDEESIQNLLQPLLEKGATLHTFGPSRQALGRFLLHLHKEQ